MRSQKLKTSECFLLQPWNLYFVLDVMFIFYSVHNIKFISVSVSTMNEWLCSSILNSVLTASLYEWVRNFLCEVGLLAHCNDVSMHDICFMTFFFEELGFVPPFFSLLAHFFLWMLSVDASFPFFIPEIDLFILFCLWSGSILFLLFRLFCFNFHDWS